MVNSGYGGAVSVPKMANVVCAHKKIFGEGEGDFASDCNYLQFSSQVNGSPVSL
jgi:hypothetical protein